MFQLRVLVVTLLVFSGFSTSSASPGTAQDAKSTNQCAADPFSYDFGPAGQKHWCGTCQTARLQAPINIPNTPGSQQPTIRFNGYDRQTSLVIDPGNPYNLKVDYKNSSNPAGTVTIGNDTFKLQEFHFHRPSEEAIDNRRFPMVAHLVHLKDQADCDAGKPGCIAAITILIEQGVPTQKTSDLLRTLFNHFPPPTGAQNAQINLEGLLPTGYENAGYWRYDGSLTTPPCTENITFYVLKPRLKFSAEQLAEFERRYPTPNAREIQPLNEREIVHKP
jgi:carbonic anhydrase